ncbi:MAG: hypothetical protein EPO68_03200 [Planctomycetota bacterium]|nr:MAG: hypothetical protein EPO68_03200 [Planctomycetota bacterium]
MQRGNERRIEWLDLATGKRLAATAWIGGGSLSPSVWGGQIALRAGEKKLALLAPRERALEPIWQYESLEEVHAPLSFEGSIYALVGDGIERLDPPSLSPVWRVEGDYRSELVLRGDKLWALSYDKKGMSWMYEIDRATGASKKLVSCGGHQGQKPERGNGPQLCALDPQVFVYHSLPIVLSDFGTTTVGMVDVTKDPTSFGTAYLAGQAVDCAGGWIVEVPYQDRGNCWVQELARTSEPPQFLAGIDSHTEFVGGNVSASIAARAVLIGARAFDLDTRRVLWGASRDLAHRAIPVRSGVLYTERGGVLSGWFAGRGGAGASGAAASAAAALPPLPALDIASGRALLRDGGVASGRFRCAAGAAEIDVVAPGGVKSKLAHEDAVLIESMDGTYQWAAEPVRYAEHLRTLVRIGDAKAWVELAREALGTKDPEIVARCVKAARELGSTDPDLSKTEKARLDLVAKPQRVNKGRADELAKREAELVVAPAKALVERSKKVPADAPRGTRLELLAAALELAPDYAPARAALEECLPAAKAGDLGWSGAEWVALAAAAHSSELRAIHDQSTGPAAERVARARDAWRKAREGEIVALGDERVVLIAVEPKQDSVRTVLGWADLACGALEELWAAPGAAAAPAASGAPPLAIWLHPDLASYHALVPQQTPDLKRQPKTALAWHDWEREAVHVVLTDDVVQRAGTQAAFAHALAHLWMRTRMPGVKPGLPLDDKLSGWWIPAGMATFVEELGFDAATRGFGVQTGFTPSFDLVGQLGNESLIEWTDLYQWDRARTARADSRGTQVVALRLELGPKVLLSQLQLYYLQSAATVHYLWTAEDGKHRAALLELVGAWHANQHKNLELEKAFGMSAAELGKRVHEWTREVSANLR